MLFALRKKRKKKSKRNRNTTTAHHWERWLDQNLYQNPMRFHRHLKQRMDHQSNRWPRAKRNISKCYLLQSHGEEFAKHRCWPLPHEGAPQRRFTTALCRHLWDSPVQIHCPPHKDKHFSPAPNTSLTWCPTEPKANVISKVSVQLSAAHGFPSYSYSQAAHRRLRAAAPQEDGAPAQPHVTAVLTSQPPPPAVTLLRNEFQGASRVKQQM